MSNQAKNIEVHQQSGNYQPVGNPQSTASGEETERTRSRRVFTPRTDIYETEEEIVLVADMPGVDDKSIDITLEKNILSINGTVPDEKVEKYQLTYAEYAVGDFVRSFTMPEKIDHDKIQATVKNGVLRLHLPKSNESKTHKVMVKSL